MHQNNRSYKGEFFLLIEARGEAEAENAERERAWSEAKSREKAEIARIYAEARDKVESGDEATARVKDKDINSKRVAASGAVTKFRVEAKSEFRYWYVGIFTDILHNVKDPSNEVKRSMVVSK